MATIKPEFDRRDVKIIGLSVDPVDNHAQWSADIEETQGNAPNYPLIGDADFSVSKLYGMLPADVVGRPHEAHARRQPDGPQRVRHRARQEGQAHPRLSDDDRAQLRRGAPRHRLAAADRQAQGRDAGELAGRRGRDHRRVGVRRRGARDLPRRLGRRRGPTSGSCRSHADRRAGGDADRHRRRPRPAAAAGLDPARPRHPARRLPPDARRGRRAPRLRGDARAARRTSTR